jgi:hypothetical protein
MPVRCPCRVIANGTSIGQNASNVSRLENQDCVSVQPMSNAAFNCIGLLGTVWRCASGRVYAALWAEEEWPLWANGSPAS